MPLPPEGMIMEGARPVSACTHENSVRYTLSNSDSGYRRPIGSIFLTDIVYIEVLR